MNKIQIKVTADNVSWDCGKFNLNDYLDCTMFEPIWVPCSQFMNTLQEIEITNENNWNSLIAKATKKNWLTGVESICHQEFRFEQGIGISNQGCNSCGSAQRQIQQLKLYKVSWIPII